MSKQEIEISPKMIEGTLSNYVRKSTDHLIESNFKSLEGKILTFLECITDSEVRQKSLKDVARQLIQDVRMSSYQYCDRISDLVAESVDEWKRPEDTLCESIDLKYFYTRSKK